MQQAAKIAKLIFIAFTLALPTACDLSSNDSSNSNAATESQKVLTEAETAITNDETEPNAYEVIETPINETESVQEKEPKEELQEIIVEDPRRDTHSFSNPKEVIVKHIELDLDVNFAKRILHGTATLEFKKQDDAATEIILDTNKLDIQKVESGGEPLEYTLGEGNDFLGQPLSIQLPTNRNTITIAYATSPEASGLQWLTPEQTAGGEHPFLFSQAQAIHARSFIPLQDSPQVRVTYSATIRTRENLLVVMSAANDPDVERSGTYEFEMPQPIPSYLIAIAVGNLEFKAMGERTGVYAEPSLLEAAAKEFEDTEAMLEATEERFGDYQWGRYDLLILPPSFPFGGMENPRLSFITPTVIAGDKSLVSLIAHELAHSWSGNSTSNATWRDLWLNEGFTTYLTYRIMEMIYGTERYDMEAVLGYQDLEEDLNDLDEGDEVLAINLTGRDPDDVFSNVPYEKGALFLRELEQKVGRDNFDKFLIEYFQHFAFQSITTDQFVQYLNQTLLKDYPALLSRPRIMKWIYEPGIPVNTAIPSSPVFANIDDLRSQWLEGSKKAADIDTSNWTVHEWLYFLNKLPEELTADQLAELDAAFALTGSKNNEIAHVWLLMTINNWYEPALPRLHEYLTTIGRNKLVKPLYRALSKSEQGRELGKRAFEEAKPGYHPLTVKANKGFFEEVEEEKNAEEEKEDTSEES